MLEERPSREEGPEHRAVMGSSLGGLVSFLVGHVMYIIGLLRFDDITPPLLFVGVLVVLAASCASFFVVGRMLNKLDLVGVLKARD